MGNLNNALQQLREERKQMQSHVGKLDQAISVIESLNGSGISRQSNQLTRVMSAPTRTISAASRRKMALAQQARWAKIRKESEPVAVTKTTTSAPVKHTMSAAARRKIAAFQRARWARIKAQQKKAA
jgi:choline dehydrogenase-like flavoprotein